MKTQRKRFFPATVAVILVIFLAISPLMVAAQDVATDTTEAVQDNSSAFNDSVKYDDMAPVFYEAEDDEQAQPATSGYGDIWLYAGAVIVLIIILIVLRKKGKKKA